MGRPTSRSQPIVIAHRGACGYLPEHTYQAKRLAYEMGADYLEQDVVATADDQLVVLHDIHLDRVSNVAAIFPGRNREDGRYYARDFTMEELRRLEVHERTRADGTNVYPERHCGDDTVYRLHSFAEELQFVAALNHEFGRTAGVYPEIKRPVWHRSEGVDITPLFVDTLNAHGYRTRNDPVYLQCFEHAELVRIRDDLGSDLKLIQLLGENDWEEAETDYEPLKTRRGMEMLASTVDGIGPWFKQLYRREGEGHRPTLQPGRLGDFAREAGLTVHPYTFRRDDLPAGFSSFDELMDFAVNQLRIDGMFTDFPDLAVRALQSFQATAS